MNRNNFINPSISSKLLRKYIAYSKIIQPKLTARAYSRLRDFYLEMRAASEAEGSPVAITARQLESLVRISEARARAALRNDVLASDADAAIAIMRRSLEEVGIDLASQKIDIDIIMTGKPKSLQDKLRIVLNSLMEMEQETGMVKKEALLDKLNDEFDIIIEEGEALIERLIKEGTFYQPKMGYLKKT
jgi:replicative DNA helicase Mcm